MKLTLKELWQAQAALERVFAVKLPLAQASLLSVAGEILLTTLKDYLKHRERVWKEMGLDKGIDQQPCKTCMKVRTFFFGNYITARRKKRAAPFFAQMALKEEQTIITLSHVPVPIYLLPDLRINIADLAVMQKLGLIFRGND